MSFNLSSHSFSHFWCSPLSPLISLFYTCMVIHDVMPNAVTWNVDMLDVVVPICEFETSHFHCNNGDKILALQQFLFYFFYITLHDLSIILNLWSDTLYPSTACGVWNTVTALETTVLDTSRLDYNDTV